MNTIKEWVKYTNVIVDEMTFHRHAQSWARELKEEYATELVLLFQSTDPISEPEDSRLQQE